MILKFSEMIKFSGGGMGTFIGLSSTIIPGRRPIKGTWEAAPGEIGMLSWAGFGLIAIGLLGHYRRKAQATLS